MHVRRDDGNLNCGPGGGADDVLGLRIASVFIILITSLAGALFPIVARGSSMIKIPKILFEYVALRMKGIHVHGFFILALRNILVRVSSYVASQALIKT